MKCKDCKYFENPHGDYRIGMCTLAAMGVDGALDCPPKLAELIVKLQEARRTIDTMTVALIGDGSTND